MQSIFKDKGMADSEAAQYNFSYIFWPKSVKFTHYLLIFTNCRYFYNKK